MAKVEGPFLSIDARGQLASTLVASGWKGIKYMRMYKVPSNPRDPKQVNVRTALTLLVPKWQALTAENKALYDLAAQGTKMSGFNLFMRQGMDAYILQKGSSYLPVSVTLSGSAPDYVFTWA